MIKTTECAYLVPYLYKERREVYIDCKLSRPVWMHCALTAPNLIYFNPLGMNKMHQSPHTYKSINSTSHSLVSPETNNQKKPKNPPKLFWVKQRKVCWEISTFQGAAAGQGEPLDQWGVRKLQRLIQTLLSVDIKRHSGTFALLWCFTIKSALAAEQYGSNRSWRQTPGLFSNTIVCMQLIRCNRWSISHTWFAIS